MSSKYKFYNPDGIYFVTFSVVMWVNVFTKDIYRKIILDSLQFCQKNKGLALHAYVIMSTHLHLIISKNGEVLLENIMRDLKKFTSSKIIKTIQSNPEEKNRDRMIKIFERMGRKNPNNKKYQFWQQDNHPIELTNNKMVENVLAYIHNNPVKKGYVDKPEDFIWSSSINYCGKKGLIDIDLIE